VFENDVTIMVDIQLPHETLDLIFPGSMLDHTQSPFKVVYGDFALRVASDHLQGRPDFGIVCRQLFVDLSEHRTNLLAQRVRGCRGLFSLGELRGSLLLSNVRPSADDRRCTHLLRALVLLHQSSQFITLLDHRTLGRQNAQSFAELPKLFCRHTSIVFFCGGLQFRLGQQRLRHERLFLALGMLLGRPALAARALFFGFLLGLIVNELLLLLKNLEFLLVASLFAIDFKLGFVELNTSPD
jgi:hypothetical protein